MRNSKNSTSHSLFCVGDEAFVFSVLVGYAQARPGKPLRLFLVVGFDYGHFWVGYWTFLRSRGFLFPFVHQITKLNSFLRAFAPDFEWPSL